MARVLLSLGSNIGEREMYLNKAIEMLNDTDAIEIVALSSIYETDPYGPVEQGLFLNMVVEIRTILSPSQLLFQLQTIETTLDRVREIRWGPRTLDLDILIYENVIMETEVLTLPHPELSKRLFVLIPLKEIKPFLIVPGLEKSVTDLLDRFSEVKGVRLWKQKIGEGE